MFGCNNVPSIPAAVMWQKKLYQPMSSFSNVILDRSSESSWVSLLIWLVGHIERFCLFIYLKIPSHHYDDSFHNILNVLCNFFYGLIIHFVHQPTASSVRQVYKILGCFRKNLSLCISCFQVHHIPLKYFLIGNPLWFLS